MTNQPSHIDQLKSAQDELAQLSAQILAQDEQLTTMRERAKSLRSIIQGANIGMAAADELAAQRAEAAKSGDA